MAIYDRAEGYPPHDPSTFAAGTGFNVGSSNSQDEFAGYGTAFNNPDRFILEMKKNIHLISPNASPFLSWATMVRKNPTPQIIYHWMEDELFTHRDVKAIFGFLDGIYYLKMKHGGDWQAFEAAALADVLAGDYDPAKPVPYMQITTTDVATTGTVVLATVPLAAGLSQAPGQYTYTADDAGVFDLANHFILADNSTATMSDGGNFADYKKHCYSMTALPNRITEILLQSVTITDGLEKECTIHMYTPDEVLQGYAQGSGLPNETRKAGRSMHNTVQIFKTPYSIANTLKAVEMYGGPELARLRLRKTIQHKVELERAIIFQGGGVEGTDWGLLPALGYENPLTRFKGIGVGAAKPGFIRTKNADLDSGFIWEISSGDFAQWNALTYRIFDDTVDAPSSTKIVFASAKWMMVLAELKFKADGTSGAFIFGGLNQESNSLGMTCSKVVTPNGTLFFVLMPLFRGQYEDYAMVIDFEHVEIRPLRGRDTQLHSNVGGQDIDGQLDFLLTEMGFELRQESAHCILKLIP